MYFHHFSSLLHFGTRINAVKFRDQKVKVQGHSGRADLPKGGGPWRVRGAAAYNGGAPTGVQGQRPWWGSEGEAPEAESFSSIFIQKGQKFSI